MFDKNIIEIIKSRKSTRTYINEPLSNEVKSKIFEIIKNHGSVPFDSSIMFKFIESGKTLNNEKIGTYGMISGAKYFIAGSVKKSRYDMEDFGYAMEKLILHMTDLNLGTCWLGASFKRTQFTGFLDIKDDEIIPAVTPVGFSKKSVKGNLIRMVIGSKNRKRWNDLFFNESFSNILNENDVGEYKVPLIMVRLAPSTVNKQPWRIVKTGMGFHFYLQRHSFFTSISSKMQIDFQRIDIGIAMCHFELACNQIGLKGKWAINDPCINTANDVLYITSWIPNK